MIRPMLTDVYSSLELRQTNTAERTRQSIGIQTEDKGKRIMLHGVSSLVLKRN